MRGKYAKKRINAAQRAYDLADGLLQAAKRSRAKDRAERILDAEKALEKARVALVEAGQRRPKENV